MTHGGGTRRKGKMAPAALKSRATNLVTHLDTPLRHLPKVVLLNQGHSFYFHIRVSKVIALANPSNKTKL